MKQLTNYSFAVLRLDIYSQGRVIEGDLSGNEILMGTGGNIPAGHDKVPQTYYKKTN